MGSFSALMGIRPCLRIKSISYCLSFCFKSLFRACSSGRDRFASSADAWLAAALPLGPAEPVGEFENLGDVEGPYESDFSPAEPTRDLL